jgi:hypothetical protein
VSENIENGETSIYQFENSGYGCDDCRDYVDLGGFMVWIKPILFSLLTVGQVDPSAGTQRGALPGQGEPPARVYQKLPTLSIPCAEPFTDSPVPVQATPVALANQDVELLPPLVVPGQSRKAPEVAEHAAETRGVEMLPSLEAHGSAPRRALVWGYAGGELYYGGQRMAPNGLSYFPLGTLDLDLNIGLLPDKKFYIFSTNQFWLQRATVNQSHGSFDWTKREYDLDFGAAWNYWGALEARVFGFALNNLNRGTSTLLPSGYNDGWGMENRYYFPTDDIYDIPRQSFVSIGYLPSKSLTGGDGQTFNPGLFAHAYLARDLHILKSYVYVDASLICEDDLAVRLLCVDAGVAARPIPAFENMEFRIGATDTYDVKPAINRGMGYFGIRFIF